MCEDVMDGQPKRGAGRPRKAVLSESLILAEAFALAEEGGADFTFAALARRLGVQPSALHHHFHGRDALIAGMRGQLTLRVGDHGFADRPWYEAIIDWATDYRDTFGSHPALIAELATMPVAGEPESVADYERIAASMVRDGYPEQLVVPAIVAIESFVIGAALDALAPDDNLRPHAALPDGSDVAPVLARTELAARTRADAAGQTPALATFEFGLRALVAGLRAAGEDPSA